MHRSQIIAVACCAIVAVALLAVRQLRRKRYEGRPRHEVAQDVSDLIGNTPLIRLRSLCEATGCEILGKAEFMNPGGSSKDRVALQIIRDARAARQFAPGGTLVEGTSGSTGISLALLARVFDYKCHIVMPDDQAVEKATLLRQLGASVTLVKPVSIVNEGHYVNVARRLAAELNAAAGDSGTAPVALFCDQFETLSNVRVHEAVTGPEIWRQTGGKVDAFVMGAGTGGTLAGVARFLKRMRSSITCALVDPPGSSLFNKVAYGVAYAPQQAERTLRRHRYDTVIEGVGIDRVTANFAAGEAHVDAAFACSDAEAVEMSRYLLRREGLFMGSSTALNCVGAVKLARKLGPGHTIVTVLCDSGVRHVSRFWNDEHIASLGLAPVHVGSDVGFVR